MNQLNTTEEIKLGKKYTLSDLRRIFNIGSEKNGSDVIKHLSKFYQITKIRRGVYTLDRELSQIEKIESQTYHKNREYIEPMIYSMLINKKSNSVTMDMHQLMKEVEIVNQDFHFIKYHTKECSEIMAQDNDLGLNIFIKESEPMLKHIIKDVLLEMEDKQLIQLNKIPILAYRIYDTDLGHIVVKKRSIIKDKDIQELLETKRRILNEHFKTDKESDIGYFNQTEFKDLIAKEYEADYFYYKYNIILNKKGLSECTDYGMDELKKSFNYYIQDKIRKSKQGDLKALDKAEKNIYIKYCIDTNTDYKLRNKKL